MLAIMSGKIVMQTHAVTASNNTVKMSRIILAV